VKKPGAFFVVKGGRHEQINSNSDNSSSGIGGHHFFRSDRSKRNNQLRAEGTGAGDSGN